MPRNMYAEQARLGETNACQRAWLKWGPYCIGLPVEGRWREIFNSDVTKYGGSGLDNLGRMKLEGAVARRFSASVEMLVPPLATVVSQLEGA